MRQWMILNAEEEAEDEPESALSSPEEPLLSVESIRRRPKLTRFIQLNPPPFCFQFSSFFVLFFKEFYKRFVE